MKRVLILVLSTDQQWYGRLAETSMQTWDAHDVEGVETIFYFGRTGGRPGTRTTLNCDCDDGFFDMGRKTLAAFEYALAMRHFDYIFRANASLYVHKPGLLQYVQDKPETGLALGVVADCGNFEGDKHSFMWGPSYLLSRDVVKQVVLHKDKWKHGAMDDNAISMLLRDIGIPLDNRASMASLAIQDGRYSSVYYEGGVSGGASAESLSEIVSVLPGQFAFRVKDDANRENDIRLMRELDAVFQANS